MGSTATTVNWIQLSLPKSTKHSEFHEIFEELKFFDVEKLPK